MNKKPFVSQKCQNVLHGVKMCHIYFISQFAQFSIFSAFWHFSGFLKLFVSHCVTVSHCDTVWQIHGCHFCETCHTCHKYQYHVTLVIKCVKEGVLVTNFNKVLGVGRKVIQRPLATTL
jgi:hypothetical protein